MCYVNNVNEVNAEMANQLRNFISESTGFFDNVL